MKILALLPVLCLSLTALAHESPEAAAHQVPEAGKKAEARHEAKAEASVCAGTHWSYGGKAGPTHWAELSPEFAACENGRQQSPIDLRWSKQKGKRKLEFHYVSGPVTVVDNGHTIEVKVPIGSYALIDGKKYSLVQFHFHSLSEHTFSGKHFPLEAHFVHRDRDGNLAVVGVVFEAGGKNSALSQLFLHLPKAAGEEKQVARFNPAELIPSIHTHYAYQGSLTTPPCSEGVNWTVLNTPLSIAPEQAAFFQRAYANNNRPLQPLHERQPASY
jgi:carbonic anhydrase